MSQLYIPRMVNLEPSDYNLVQHYAREKGLGSKGFSATLRLILREWLALRQQLITPPIPTSQKES